MNKTIGTLLALSLTALFSAPTHSIENVKSVHSDVKAKLLINVNTASVEQLTSIKGLGSAKAQAIVDYISQNGKLSSLDELVNVKGIGVKLTSKLAPYLAVN